MEKSQFQELDSGVCGPRPPGQVTVGKRGSLFCSFADRQVAQGPGYVSESCTVGVGGGHSHRLLNCYPSCGVLLFRGASLVARLVKNPPAVQETPV